MKVLELGCGLGAITRFLVERGAEVPAVEGSYYAMQLLKYDAVCFQISSQNIDILTHFPQFENQSLCKSMC